MERQKVAVIGAGISGLSAAYFLAPHAHVTVFEEDDRLGGHANTAHITLGQSHIDVDTGFMVYNPIRYPHLMALFRELDVPSVSTVMSFSVSIPGVVEYSSDLTGLFGDLRQTLRVDYIAFLLEILRFNRTAKRLLRNADAPEGMTLGAFLKARHFSHRLTEQYLYPMMGSIWSAPVSAIAEFPALESLRFLDNHLLLNIFGKPQWRTVRGGSRVYVEKLSQHLRSEGVILHTNAPVVAIRRENGSVIVRTDREHLFDSVVCATHADITLSLLSDASDEERDALSRFRYSSNSTYLHTDTSFMPRRRSAWASWNYHGQRDSSRVSLTYYMNALQHIPRSAPVFVTLNPERAPAHGTVYGQYRYSHPIFDAGAGAAREKVEKLQGARATYFAGAYLGYGFHEDGIASAARAVGHMNVPLRITL